jgi:hypothetical protein
MLSYWFTERLRPWNVSLYFIRSFILSGKYECFRTVTLRRSHFIFCIHFNKVLPQLQINAGQSCQINPDFHHAINLAVEKFLAHEEGFFAPSPSILVLVILLCQVPRY